MWNNLIPLFNGLLYWEKIKHIETNLSSPWPRVEGLCVIFPFSYLVIHQAICTVLMVKVRDARPCSWEWFDRIILLIGQTVLFDCALYQQNFSKHALLKSCINGIHLVFIWKYMYLHTIRYYSYIVLNYNTYTKVKILAWWNKGDYL